MLQLQIADANLSSGSVAVSWCLDHEILKRLADEKLTDPQVIIVVAPTENYHLSKESRKVVPLKDLMTYIECRVAGKNKIYGLISTRKPKDAREHYLSKDGNEFQNNVLDYDGEGYSSRLIGAEDDEHREPGTYQFLSDPLDIEVPKAAFAKDPPKWEKPWVNHYFRQKVVDQCHYRRRRIFAYGVQPFIVLAFSLVKTLILLAGLLTGAREWSLKYYKPLTYGIRDTFDIWENGSFFIHHQPEDDDPNEELKYLPPGYLLRSFWSLPFMPLFAIPMALFVWNHHPVAAFSVLGTLVGLGALLCLISYLATNGNGGKFIKKAWDKVTSLFVSDELWYLQQEDMELITCNTDKKPTTYKSLSGKRKTVRLRFQNLKTKVCRPFSL